MMLPHTVYQCGIPPYGLKTLFKLMCIDLYFRKSTFSPLFYISGKEMHDWGRRDLFVILILGRIWLPSQELREVKWHHLLPRRMNIEAGTYIQGWSQELFFHHAGEVVCC